MYLNRPFESSYYKTLYSTHVAGKGGHNRGLLQRIASYFDVVSPDNPLEQKEKKPEYAIDIYENRRPHFGSVREEYEQEEDFSQPFIRTPVSRGPATPPEQLTETTVTDSESQFGDYEVYKMLIEEAIDQLLSGEASESNPEADMLLIELRMEQLKNEKSANAAEAWTDNHDSAGPPAVDILDDAIPDTENSLPEANMDEILLDDFQSNTLESSIDEILEDGPTAGSTSLDTLISDILGEPPMQEEQEDVPPELMEKEMPY